MVVLSTRASANLVECRARARYFYGADGVRRLHSIQFSSRPCFRKDGWEREAPRPKKGGAGDGTPPDGGAEGAEAPTDSGVCRASQRRAQKSVFELSLCNPDLDAFFTLTFSPEAVKDRGSYEDVYKEVKVWFSNRVQRKGLKYILVAERHKHGGIHFHGFCNSGALKLVEAINPHTGKVIYDKGRPVYNIADWSRLGFSTCKILPSAVEDRVKASKYVTKYITKDTEKIGGRYYLHGGDLKGWEYEYGQSADDLTAQQPRSWWYTDGDGYSFTEYSYL